MTCPALTAAHDGYDVRRMLLFVGGFYQRHANLCRGCRERLEEMGLDFREERRAEPVREPWRRMRRVA